MLTRFWFFLICAVGSLAFWWASLSIRHPIKAELWLAVAVVLGIVAVAERLKQ